MKTMTERRVVMSAVRAYWVPPFLGTFTIWVTVQRTKSIHAIAAAKENPPTMELRVWVWSSWVTRSTVFMASAADMVIGILYSWKKNYSNESFSFSTCFLNFLVFIDFVLEKSCSSSDESSLELVSDSYFLNESFVNDHGSGSELLITINSIF